MFIVWLSEEKLNLFLPRYQVIRFLSIAANLALAFAFSMMRLIFGHFGMDSPQRYEYDLTGLDDSVFLRRVRSFSADSSTVEYKVFAAPGMVDPYTYVVEVRKDSLSNYPWIG